MLNIQVNKKDVKPKSKAVNYYLKESNIDNLARIAKLHNKKGSTLLNEILEEVLPQLEKN